LTAYQQVAEGYVRGEWSRDFSDSIIIPTEKKQGAQECVQLEPCLKDRKLELKKRIIKCLTRNVALYAAETDFDAGR